MNNKQPVHDQHYIPVSYTRFFSIDNTVRRPQLRIYVHHPKKNLPQNPIPTESLFHKKHIYEIKDEDGHWINFNDAEDALSVDEASFSQLIRELQNRGESEMQKCNTKINFIAQSEYKELLKMFSCQPFRFSSVLTEFKEKLLNGKRAYIKRHNIKESTIEQMVHQTCLPSFLQYSEEPREKVRFNMPLFPAILYLQLLFMPCAIGYTASGDIITGDTPYHTMSRKEYRKLKTHEGRIIYPLTSNMVLCFYPNKKQYRDKHWQLFTLTSQDVLSINHRIATSSGIICSKKPFTDTRLQEIYNAP